MAEMADMSRGADRSRAGTAAPERGSTARRMTLQPAIVAEHFAKTLQLLREEAQPHNIRRSLYCRDLILPFFLLPVLCLLWRATNTFAPPSWHARAPVIFWGPGYLNTTRPGQPAVCPNYWFCADGAAQLVTLLLSGLSAYALYCPLVLAAVSRMQGLLNALSRTAIAVYVPFEYSHSVHRNAGVVLLLLSLSHTVFHLARFAQRSESVGHALFATADAPRYSAAAGWVALLLLIYAVLPMLWVRSCSRLFSFEARMRMHYLFVPYYLVLMVHYPSTLVPTCAVALALVVVDRAYVLLRRTHHVPNARFRASQNGGGVLIEFEHPEGFAPNAGGGEFVRLCVPWLGPSYALQWHPFSLYPTDDADVCIASATGGGAGGGAGGGPGSADNRSSAGGHAATAGIDVAVVGGAAGRVSAPSALSAAIASSSAVGAPQSPCRRRSRIFVAVAGGNWSQALAGDVAYHRTLQRDCWVQGPFGSPYALATSFETLLLVATGVGITPAVRSQRNRNWSSNTGECRRAGRPLLARSHARRSNPRTGPCVDSSACCSSCAARGASSSFG